MTDKFYDNLLTNKSKKVKLLNNLYKKPIKDKGKNVPHFQVSGPNITHQADLLFLPNDDGYRYSLTVTDIYDGKTDARPLKTKTADEVLKAFKNIYSSSILKMPKKIEVDSGSEFKGDVAKYFKQNKVIVRVGIPGRHRQQAMVERKNQTIGTAIHKRQTGQEIITGVPSTEWTTDLPPIIKVINRKLHVRFPKPKTTPVCEGSSCKLLNIGDKVRIMLDVPISATEDEKKLHGKFRSSDIRWTPQIHTINNIILKPNFPPLYMVEGNNKASYTKNQLQLVVGNEKMPNPEKYLRGEQTVFKIEKILEKKKIKNIWKVKIKWIGYDTPTWETYSKIKSDVPELMQEFENKNKKINIKK